MPGIWIAYLLAAVLACLCWYGALRYSLSVYLFSLAALVLLLGLWMCGGLAETAGDPYNCFRQIHKESMEDRALDGPRRTGFRGNHDVSRLIHLFLRA